MAADPGILDRVDPGKLADALHGHRDEHTPIEAAATWAEPLQAVDGGKAGLGIVKGEQFPVNSVPSLPRGAFGRLLEPVLYPIGKSRLRGCVSQGIGSSLDQDVPFRHFQYRIPGALVKTSPNGGLPDLYKSLAEAVVIPVSAFERAVDEEFQHFATVFVGNISRLGRLVGG